MSIVDIPLISVVVCTHGRRSSLARCLASLENLDDPRYETLLIDNGPSPSVADLFATNGARIVHEPRRGLDFARNRGVAEAAGDIIAFIDDDCEAEPSWLKGIRAHFADGEIACVTGRVMPGSLERASHRLFENISTFDRGLRPRRFARKEGARVVPSLAAQVGTGCNMAFRRDILERVGEFDPALDMGTFVGGGGDIDMFVRVLRAGGVTEYAPQAVVRHHHRDSLVALARQLFGYSTSVGALSAKYAFSRSLRPRAALRHQWEWFAWIVRATLLRPTERRLVGIALFLVCTVGNLYGPVAYLMSGIRARRLAAT